VSMVRLPPSDENRLAFGFGGGVVGGRAGRGVSLSCEGNPFLLSGVKCHSERAGLVMEGECSARMGGKTRTVLQRVPRGKARPPVGVLVGAVER
jgi:hypothetical protein